MEASLEGGEGGGWRELLQLELRAGVEKVLACLLSSTLSQHLLTCRQVRAHSTALTRWVLWHHIDENSWESFLCPLWKYCIDDGSLAHRLFGIMLGKIWILMKPHLRLFSIKKKKENQNHYYVWKCPDERVKYCLLSNPNKYGRPQVSWIGNNRFLCCIVVSSVKNIHWFMYLM